MGAYGRHCGGPSRLFPRIIGNQVGREYSNPEELNLRLCTIYLSSDPPTDCDSMPSQGQPVQTAAMAHRT
jgi:hypothetical protein